jgi:hypothetical protein
VVVNPDYYVWDGDEYVGYYNGSYFYLSGNIWLPLSGDRYDRFHRWERSHSDWRSHAYRSRYEHRGYDAHHYYRDRSDRYDRNRYDNDRNRWDNDRHDRDNDRHDRDNDGHRH